MSRFLWFLIIVEFIIILIEGKVKLKTPKKKYEDGRKNLIHPHPVTGKLGKYQGDTFRFEYLEKTEADKVIKLIKDRDEQEKNARKNINRDDQEPVGIPLIFDHQTREMREMLPEDSHSPPKMMRNGTQRRSGFAFGEKAYAPQIVRIRSYVTKGDYTAKHAKKYCTGTIITMKAVITAMHCLFNYDGPFFPQNNDERYRLAYEVFTIEVDFSPQKQLSSFIYWFGTRTNQMSKPGFFDVGLLFFTHSTITTNRYNIAYIPDPKKSYKPPLYPDYMHGAGVGIFEWGSKEHQTYTLADLRYSALHILGTEELQRQFSGYVVSKPYMLAVRGTPYKICDPWYPPQCLEEWIYKNTLYKKMCANPTGDRSYAWCSYKKKADLYSGIPCQCIRLSGPCNGDSGSPLYRFYDEPEPVAVEAKAGKEQKMILVGVESGGRAKYCSVDTGHYSVYTNVMSFRDKLREMLIWYTPGYNIGGL